MATGTQTAVTGLSTTMGKFTKVGIGAGADATTFDPICIFGDVEVDFGSFAINEENCLSSDTPFVSLGQVSFTEQTFTYPWTEGTGDKATKTIKDAHEAKTAAAKTISVEFEMSNSADGTKKGTLYTANFMVTNYKVTAPESGINKSVFTVKQLSKPVETAAAV